MEHKQLYRRKCQPKTVPSYIQLNWDLTNLKLQYVSKDPDKWITLVESYEIQMKKFIIPDKTDMNEVDLIIHILASLPEEHEVAVSVLKDCLMDTTAAAHPGIEMVCKKIILRHDCIKQH